MTGIPVSNETKDTIDDEIIESLSSLSGAIRAFDEFARKRQIEDEKFANFTPLIKALSIIDRDCEMFAENDELFIWDEGYEFMEAVDQLKFDAPMQDHDIAEALKLEESINEKLSDELGLKFIINLRMLLQKGVLVPDLNYDCWAHSFISWLFEKTLGKQKFWISILQHANINTSLKPSKKWQKTAYNLIQDTPDFEEELYSVLSMMVVSEDVSEITYKLNSEGFILKQCAANPHPDNVNTLKGLLWFLGFFDREKTLTVAKPIRKCMNTRNSKIYNAALCGITPF